MYSALVKEQNGLEAVVEGWPDEYQRSTLDPCYCKVLSALQTWCRC